MPDKPKPKPHGFVEDRTRSGAKVYTDDQMSHVGMRDRHHEAVQHSIGEYVRNQVHANGMESLWAMLKRRYQGIFHHVSEKHLGYDVTKFAGRHNISNANTIDQMEDTAAGTVGQRLRYLDSIS